MHPQAADFTQAQIPIFSDLRDRKSRTVQTTRNHAPRTPTSLTQDQIPQCVTSPTGQRLENHISREVFPTRRRLERNPRTQRPHIVLRVAAVLHNRNRKEKKERESKDKKAGGAGHGRRDYTKPLRITKLMAILRASCPD